LTLGVPVGGDNVSGWPSFPWPHGPEICRRS